MIGMAGHPNLRPLNDSMLAPSITLQNCCGSHLLLAEELVDGYEQTSDIADFAKVVDTMLRLTSAPFANDSTKTAASFSRYSPSQKP